MRVRLVLPVALLVGAAVATPSLAAAPKLAAAKPLSWTDVSGDANAINDQGGISPVGPNQTSTPAQVSSADIVGVAFARLDNGKKALGFTVTMKLSGAPAQGTLYRVTGAADGCTTFWFQYNWTAGGAATSTLRNDCVPSDSPTAVVSPTVSTPIAAKVVGSSIVWTVLLKDLPEGVKLGSVLSPALGETRAILGVAGAPQSLTAPVLDQTATQTSTYKIGQ